MGWGSFINESCMISEGRIRSLFFGWGDVCRFFGWRCLKGSCIYRLGFKEKFELISGLFLLGRG